MDDEAFLDALRQESAALSAAARNNLGAGIPAVDGWTVGEVVVHVGQGAHWITKIVQDDLDGHAALEALDPDPSLADEPALLAWFDDAAAEMVAALEAAGPDARGWTFGDPDRALSYWWRRRAHETAVHRWDVDSAQGSPAPIDRDLAVDGIDEFFEVFLPRVGTRVTGEGQTLHLHGTDEGLAEGTGEWTVTFGPDGLRWARGHAKGDAAVRGAASDLLLLLWNRVPPSRLEVFGDQAVLDRWSAQVRI
jgi:uncharacterized protein (TIGR03083 family)